MSAVLLIDDSPEDRDQFSYLLEQAKPGLTVLPCRDGDDGIVAAKAQYFDCVLLDLHLEGESGLDVLAKLQEVRPNLPVIVFSGQGNERAAVDAFVSGAAYYLPKQDLTSATLWTAVSRVIAQAETDRELMSKRETLERSNRLDAVGQLAAGIAHDFNNQLGALRYCVALLGDATDPDKMKARVSSALKIIDESANLATRMLSLSRQGDLLARSVPVQDVFSDLRALASTSISDKVLLEIEEPDPDLSVLCDPGQLLNALVNLILNASDAISASGAMGVVKVSAQSDANAVRVIVADNGIGMSQDVLAKCTDPFFTTKSDTNGTGLGLAIVQGFANDNKGDLLIQSTPEGGSQVTLILPFGHPEPVPNSPPTPPATPNDQSADILLVEDQFQLALMTQEILEEQGYTVELAHDGQTALECLSLGFRPDLILSDIKMPEMSGFEFASEVWRQNPHAKIVFVTGYADNHADDQNTLNCPILQKPVEPDALLATIKQVLEGDKP